MKKSHIVVIVVIAVAIGIIITSAGDSSSYVTFDQAAQMGGKDSFHVVGELKKDANGHITGIAPGADKVSFSFVMIDENKREERVQSNEPMPPDFTKSEKVVVIGGYRGDVFIADKILLKCPSKYQEQKELTVGELTR